MRTKTLIYVKIHKIHMAHITLSIPDEMHQEMKRHPEIKWSEAARKGIREQLLEMKGILKGEDWLNSLPSSTKNRIRELKKLPKEDWRKWHKQVKEKEWKKARFLTRVS